MTQSAYPQTQSMNLRQAMLLSATLVLSRYSTFLPQAAARIGSEGGWLLPLFTCVPLIVCLYLGWRLLRGQEELRLDLAFSQRLPRWLYRLFMAVYAAAGLIYCALYLRLYVSKLSVMIFFESSPHVFSLALLAVVGVILTGAPVVLARINGLVSVFMAFVLWIITVLMLPGGDLSRLYPVTSGQIHAMIPGGIALGGVWLYFLLPFLCGDRIVVVGQPLKTTLLFTLGMIVTIFGVTFTILSQLGAELTESLYLPLLFALRASELSLLERSEVLLVTLWVLGDAMFICIMARMALHTAGQALGCGFKRFFILPGLAAIFVLSLTLGSNADAIQRQAEQYYIPLNLVFGLGLPALALLIGPLYQGWQKRRAARRREKVREVLVKGRQEFEPNGQA